MSDTPSAPQSSPTGEPSPAAVPAADSAAPAFGTSRGSGLSRGKRAMGAAPVAAQQSSDNASSYKPTAIAVIEPPRTHSGFGSTENDNATAVVEEKQVAPAAAVTPAAVEPKRETTPIVEPTVATPAEPAPTAAFTAPREQRSNEKPPLNILPPEPKRQNDHRWERSADRPQRSEQGQWQRPERPQRQQENQRQAQPQAPAREQSKRADTPPRTQQPIAAEKKSGGLWAWLKSLFSSSETSAENAGSQHEQRQDGFRGDRGGRGRSRGGRGRGRGRDGFRSSNNERFSRGPETQRPEGENSSEFRQENDGDRSNFSRGDRGGRGRSRGGRGRGRDGYRGGNNSDDQQQGWRNSGDGS